MREVNVVAEDALPPWVADFPRETIVAGSAVRAFPTAEGLSEVAVGLVPATTGLAFGANPNWPTSPRVLPTPKLFLPAVQLEPSPSVEARLELEVEPTDQELAPWEFAPLPDGVCKGFCELGACVAVVGSDACLGDVWSEDVCPEDV